VDGEERGPGVGREVEDPDRSSAAADVEVAGDEVVSARLGEQAGARRADLFHAQDLERGAVAHVVGAARGGVGAVRELGEDELPGRKRAAGMVKGAAAPTANDGGAGERERSAREVDSAAAGVGGAEGEGVGSDDEVASAQGRATELGVRAVAAV